MKAGDLVEVVDDSNAKDHMQVGDVGFVLRSYNARPEFVDVKILAKGEVYSVWASRFKLLASKEGGT